MLSDIKATLVFFLFWLLCYYAAGKL